MRRLRPHGTGVGHVQLLLMRHGESQGNREMRLQGRKDFPLTGRGRSQALALGQRLASSGISAVYSSPITRALDTARIIGDATGLEVREDARLQEYDFGELLSGLTWKEIRELRPQLVASLMGDDSEFPHYPGEEGRAAFRARVCGAITEIAGRHADDNAVAIVTHAGPIIVYTMEVLGRKYSRPRPFNIDNASVTTIAVNSKGAPHLPAAVLTGLNDTCHLRVNSE